MNSHKVKWVFVSGGVLSGLGKGIVNASIGKLLPPSLKVVPVKCDGYLNVDPGTMNPYEHGEVFVLEDGGEVDMDFGHYERFLNINCKFDWNLTSGKIYLSVIEKERRGDYLGKTVQMIPHVTDEIKSRLRQIAVREQADVMLIELGGTVGDIEMQLFYEAVRQMIAEEPKENVLYCHLTLVPTLSVVGEQKTKPTQQSVALLRQVGIQPDVIIARSEDLLAESTKKKIALFCNISPRNVISDPDLKTVYELPLVFRDEGLSEIIAERFGLREMNDLSEWELKVKNLKHPKKEVTVALCGKYTGLEDSYVSIIEALTHATAVLGTKVNIKWIETTDLEKGVAEVADLLKDVKGVIVPGGFGVRGVEGKIEVIKYCRENDIPFLGLCLGLQLAVIEFARNVCGLESANSEEFDKSTPHPVIHFLPEQVNLNIKGGTMRLGSYMACLEDNSRVRDVYGKDAVSERHRHRYEVNNDYAEILASGGMVLSGFNKERSLVEFVELPDKKFYVATQAHPELKSRLERPAPLFLEFIRACARQ